MRFQGIREQLGSVAPNLKRQIVKLLAWIPIPVEDESNYSQARRPRMKHAVLLIRKFVTVFDVVPQQP